VSRESEVEMGAFFLYRRDANLSLEEAQAVFLKKGLGTPYRFELGEWSLLLFRKMLVDVENSATRADGKRVFCCGTVSYQGLGYRDSLERLLSDFLDKRLAQERALGNFCLLFWDGRAISLLTDRQNAQHVFMNDERTCLSSSFLAVLAARRAPSRLNRMALLEKLSSGYIVSPDTLVEGIYQLNEDLLASLARTSGIQAIAHPPVPDESEVHRRGFADSVRSQTTVLSEYFRNVRALARESSAELGLSSGFDSRLLFALSQSFEKPIPLHCHHTVNVHESELAIARTLASVGGSTLTVFPTTRLEEQDEESRRQAIFDCLYFFDARCIHDMGSFSETYTAWYRKKVLCQNRLSFHGLGGEIYRNASNTPTGYIGWNDWCDLTVFYPFAREACGSERAFCDMRAFRNAKISKRLGVDLSGSVDYHTERRYYGRVRMPDNASNVSNAYNQVAFLLMPYIEADVVSEALKASRYIGAGGAYEAAMIRELSPSIAAVDSQYGYPFSHIPLKCAFRDRLVAGIPLSVRHGRMRKRLLTPSLNPNVVRQRQVRLNSPVIREIESVLRDLVPGADWDSAFCPGTQEALAISVGSFIKEFHHKLRF
jgi:hypothetical protein